VAVAPCEKLVGKESEEFGLRPSKEFRKIHFHFNTFLYPKLQRRKSHKGYAECTPSHFALKAGYLF
jgi:hypothetical protein